MLPEKHCQCWRMDCLQFLLKLLYILTPVKDEGLRDWIDAWQEKRKQFFSSEVEILTILFHQMSNHWKNQRPVRNSNWPKARLETRQTDTKETKQGHQMDFLPFSDLFFVHGYLYLSLSRHVHEWRLLVRMWGVSVRLWNHSSSCIILDQVCILYLHFCICFSVFVFLCMYFCICICVRLWGIPPALSVTRSIVINIYDPIFRPHDLPMTEPMANQPVWVRLW